MQFAKFKLVDGHVALAVLNDDNKILTMAAFDNDSTVETVMDFTYTLFVRTLRPQDPMNKEAPLMTLGEFFEKTGDWADVVVCDFFPED